MEVERFSIAGVLAVTPRRFGDERGYFSEVFNARALAEVGIHDVFVQDNQSYSASAGTIRGLHYQAPPHAQGKLVRVLRGSVLDVAVDIRNGSPTYGQHVSIELSASNGKQLWVPPGFLHGFATLEADVDVAYKVTAFYNAEADGSILWNDPALGIDWGLPGVEPCLSEKDEQAPSFERFNSPFVYNDLVSENG